MRDGTVPEKIAKDAQEMHFVALNELSKLKGMLLRHAKGFRSWFDPNSLRASALLSPDCDASCLNVCKQGLVFDEETTFATFNSYFLYRQGIPTRMVATRAEFDKVANLDETKREYVILEDVELNYGDIQLGSSKESKEEIKEFLPEPDEVEIHSSLIKRLVSWGLTDKTEFKRVFVSTSRLTGKHGKSSVIKPFGGLNDRILLHLSAVNGGVVTTRNTATGSGHSAPGAQQAVAAKLLERVRILQTSAKDTESAVHAALLALEAERLLNRKTYAMSIEALTERHVLESVAECAFEGAADDLEVRMRIADLKVGLYKLVFHKDNGWKVFVSLLPCSENTWAEWCKLPKRCVQFSNGMLECVGRLRETYHQFSKVDEEEEALKSIRWWRLAVFLLKLSFREKWFGFFRNHIGACFTRIILWLVNVLEFLVRLCCGPIWAYFNLVLSPPILVMVITCWVLLFGWMFQEVSLSGGIAGTETLTLSDWMRHSLITFVALQPGIIGDPKLGSETVFLATREGYSNFWCLTAAEMVLGYLHLPVFITLLIQKFSRR